MQQEKDTSYGYWLKDTVCLGLILLFVIRVFWPLLSQPNSQVTDDYDGLFIAWQLGQVSQKLTSFDFKHFFEGPIYYPNRLTLAFSDPFVTSSLLSIPLWLVTHDPVVLLNFSTVLAQVLTLTMMFFLLHEVSRDRLVALTLTLVFGFSPLRMIYVGHLQQFQIAGLILMLLALVKIKQGAVPGWLMVWVGGLWFQAGNNFLTAWFGLFATGIMVLTDPDLRQRFRWWAGLIALVGLIPIIIPYLNVSQIYAYVRPITDVINFSLSPEEIFTVFYSPLLYLVFILALVVGTRRAKPWVITGVGALIMALGPALHWMGKTVKILWHIPLPYLLFYYLAPGFQGFRTPSRWILLAGLTMTVGSSIALARIKQPWRWRLMVGLLMILGFQLKPIATMAVPTQDEYPMVYTWLKQQPGKVVIELPIFRWGSDSFSKNEVYRMLYQFEHGKILVNGYSGFSPPAWEALVAKIQKEFPSEGLIAELKQMGVEYLIIHEDEYVRWRGEKINLDEKKYWLKQEYRDTKTVVYRFL